VKERKLSQQSRIRVREPDVAVARANILRERQQVASWHRESPAETMQYNQSFTFKVSIISLVVALLLSNTLSRFMC